MFYSCYFIIMFYYLSDLVYVKLYICGMAVAKQT